MADKNLIDLGDFEQKEPIGFNAEKQIKNAIKQMMKFSAWIALIVSIAILALVLAMRAFGLSFNLRSFAVFAIVATLCSITVYFSFRQDGQLSGKNTPEYKDNLQEYKGLAVNRRRSDINAFIKFAREEEKEEYIIQACAATGLTGKEIRNISKAELRKSKEFTKAQKRYILNLKNNTYPDTQPKNAAEVLNILANNPKASHGVDAGAKKRFLKARATKKIFIAITLAVFSASIAIEFSLGNWQETLVKFVMSLASLLMSLFTGYNDGYISTASIEKDILASTSRFLQDMDVWLLKANTKTGE